MQNIYQRKSKNMYYKKKMERPGAWIVFKESENSVLGDKCIASDIDELDADRILSELELVRTGSTEIEIARKGPAYYRLVLFSTGWAVFLDSQDLKGGTLMITGQLTTREAVELIMLLNSAELPQGIK
jgi:hypothetical protein